MIIVFIGGPGSGKGAQINLLTKRLPLIHISMGDMLRKSVVDGSKLGRLIEESLSSGYLILDEIVISLLENPLKNTLSTKWYKGLILDGFPRTLQQANYLDNFLKMNKIRLDIVIYLDLDYDTLHKRNVGRRFCSNCGKDYNIFFKPPKIDELCDLCGNKLVQRHDSSIESINNRLFEYKTKTVPVIDYYREKNLLFVVDGEKTKKEIHEKIIKKLRFIL